MKLAFLTFLKSAVACSERRLPVFQMGKGCYYYLECSRSLCLFLCGFCSLRLIRKRINARFVYFPDTSNILAQVLAFCVYFSLLAALLRYETMFSHNLSVFLQSIGCMPFPEAVFANLLGLAIFNAVEPWQSFMNIEATLTADVVWVATIIGGLLTVYNSDMDMRWKYHLLRTLQYLNEVCPNPVNFSTNHANFPFF